MKFAYFHPTIRPLRPNDVEAVLAMHRRASPDSLYRRFHSAYQPGWTAVKQMCALETGFVALVGKRVVGLAYFVVENDLSAEVAFLVEDAYQKQGIGTKLCRHLVQLARQRGLQTLTAYVANDNVPMMRVFAKSRLPYYQQSGYDGRTVVLPLSTDQPFFPQRNWDTLLNGLNGVLKNLQFRPLAVEPSLN